MPNTMMTPKEALTEVTRWAQAWFKVSPTTEPAPLSHMDWARQQLPLSSAIRAIITVDANPVSHHCRIGKITLKHDAR